MRRPNRHIEIFSISALDLFASALGAFILVAIILFPYYLKDQKNADALDKVQAKLAASSAETQQRDAVIRALQAKSSEDRARLESLQDALKHAKTAPGKPFLVIGIRWSTPGADIDLHVIDPDGHEFDWYKNNVGRRDYPDSSAELSFDMTSGPAMELWQDPSARPGTYRVEYVANALPAGYQTAVHGMVIDKDGLRDLPVKTLKATKERVNAATLMVGSDGLVAIR